MLFWHSIMVEYRQNIALKSIILNSVCKKFKTLNMDNASFLFSPSNIFLSFKLTSHSPRLLIKLIFLRIINKHKLTPQLIASQLEHFSMKFFNNEFINYLLPYTSSPIKVNAEHESNTKTF